MKSHDEQFCRLDDLGVISRGRSQHRPRNAPHLYGGTMPFIQTGDITNSELYVSRFSQTYSQAGIDQSRVCEPGVLCIVNAGVNTGDSAILAIKACFPDSVIVFKADRSKCNPAFIKYYLDSIKLGIRSITMGATQDNLSVTKLLTIPIPSFPLAEQGKIAAILTAYDDLIETNKRRIAVLEQMAEELYREWFVRMRFPGYQNTKFIKGVPEGWKEIELRQICDEASKSTKAGEHLSDRFYLPLDSLATRQMLPVDHYDYTAAQSSLALFEQGDILFGAMRPYQHKVVVAPFDGVTRTTMFVIRPKEIYLHAYCYLNLFQNSSIEHATLICNGADRPYVVWSRAMERMKVFLPQEETLAEFEKLAGPILASIREFYFIQRKLTEARDLLLPRLISGKLSVEDLDIQFPPSMQEKATEPAHA